MDAFVTGGSGFVGGRLLESLADRGDDALALARSESPARTVESRGAGAVRGDLADVDGMADGMAGCDVVFHLAAKVDEWGAPAAFRAVNVEGTANAIEAARAAGIGRFVHASTEAVLADGEPKRGVDETHPSPRTRWVTIRRRRPRPNASSAGPTATGCGRASSGRGSSGSTAAATRPRRATSTTPSRGSCGRPSAAPAARRTSSRTATPSSSGRS